MTGTARKLPNAFIGLSFLMLGLMAVVMSLQAPSMQFPELQTDLDTDSSNVELIATVYMVFGGAFMVTFGKLADIHGRRRVFLISAVAFALACVLSGLAPNIWILLVGRAISGIALAGLATTAVGLVNAGFTEPRARGIAFAIWGAAFGLAITFGSLLGALVDWRIVFFVEAVVVVVSIAGVLWSVGESERCKTHFDVVGTIFLVVGLMALIFGLDEASKSGWLFPTDAASVNLGMSLPFWLFVIFGICIAGLIVYDRKHAQSGHEVLVDPELFAQKRFTRGNLTVVLFFLGAFGFIEIYPLFLQLVLGYGGASLAFAYLPIGIGWTAGSFIASPLGHRYGARNATAAGIVLCLVGMIPMIWLLSPNATSLTLLGPTACVGLGLGIAYARISDIVLIDVPAEKSSLGGGILVMFRITSVAVGTALLGAILAALALNAAVSDVKDVPGLTSSQQETVETVIRSGTNNSQGRAGGGGTTNSGTNSGTSIADERNDPAVKHAYDIAVADGYARAMQLVTALSGLLVLISIGSCLWIPKDSRTKDEPAGPVDEGVPEHAGNASHN